MRRCSPVVVKPERDHHLIRGEVLAIEPERQSATHSASSCRRSCRYRNAVALVRTTRRETLDLASPNAAGMASAAASYSRYERPPQHTTKQPDIPAAWSLKLRVDGQRHFSAGRVMPDPRDRDR